MENLKIPNQSSQIEEILLKQLDNSLTGLKELLQRQWLTLGELYVALTHCRTIESALFRVSHFQAEAYLKTAKEKVLKKLEEAEKSSREWTFIFVISKEACGNYKKKIEDCPAKKDILAWWEEVKKISETKKRSSA